MDAERSLGLSARARMPGEIAYLRERFSGSAWSAHPNYGALAAFWQQVHGELRAEGAAIRFHLQEFRDGRRSAQDFPRTFGGALQHHLGHLDLHHRVEDAVYFPKFRSLDARMVAGFDLLERDHEAIHRLLDEVVLSGNGLLGAIGGEADGVRRAADAHAHHVDDLLKTLDRHLDDEEDLVIPALLEHGERSVA